MASDCAMHYEAPSRVRAVKYGAGDPHSLIGKLSSGNVEGSQCKVGPIMSGHMILVIIKASLFPSIAHTEHSESFRRNERLIKRVVLGFFEFTCHLHAMFSLFNVILYH